MLRRGAINYFLHDPGCDLITLHPGVNILCYRTRRKTDVTSPHLTLEKVSDMRGVCWPGGFFFVIYTNSCQKFTAMRLEYKENPEIVVGRTFGQ